ncbi:MAG TPA: type ISP restriction/modification enzyme, partial [Anaerolineae bacterium]
MSVQLIRQYHAKVDKIIRYGGSRNESALRKPFQDLLEQYARARNLEMIAELDYRTRFGTVVYPDGTLKDALRQDWGYWESKDEQDDLQAEIAAKLAKGYPTSNILFEDTQTAVLVQAGQEVSRVDFKDDVALDHLLTQFVSYESREVRQFREAIEQFAQEVPALAAELRGIIEEQTAANAAFRQAAESFLELGRKAINPAVEMADVREMIIQHVLTQDIFTKIFDDPQFHQENNIAHRLSEVVNTFHHGATRRQINDRLGHYYATINARAAQIYNHQEKQKFLKALYENFYKAYNPKGADRLGIVYTPNEIVRFMIEATDHLLFKHFGKTLGDPNVDILDPATGTGTFITELIEYLPPHQLEPKYRHEIHCNEVAILPYYIANLNIEYTYRQKMGRYEAFHNIVFVDTLDNLGFQFANKQLDFFHLADENVERIERQNQREISVIIGNPPYNAWQENFNFQNPNRPYKEVDRRIKDTYVKHGTAQNQNALYDMYTRFIRWSTDRLGKNGIIAFVSNNSFIDAQTYDGFRKVTADEFSEIYIIDLKGYARTSGERRQREAGNVFGDTIRVGVAVYFLVRREKVEGCHIYYNAIRDYVPADEKQNYLRDNNFEDLSFEHIVPNKRHTWINQTENDWDDLLLLFDRKTKETVFNVFSNGVKTQRDEWVYDFSNEALVEKMGFFVDVYRQTLQNPDYPDRFQIKWDADMTRYWERGISKTFNQEQIVTSLYRPFVKMHFYFDPHFNGRTYQLPDIFPDQGVENRAIVISDKGFRSTFSVLGVDSIPDLHLCAGVDAFQCLPLYRYTDRGERVENITDWALAQFRAQYGDESITKWDIFYTVYGLLHHPDYRERYT